MHRAIAASSALHMPLPDMLNTDPRDLTHRLPPGLHDVASLVARCSTTDRAQARDLLDKLAACGADAITATDPDWPSTLARLGTAMPPIIFFKGRRDLLAKPAAAVVGARDPSNAGARLASNCAAFFAAEHIAIVSGGARGVDTRAHLAAIHAGGKTLVVLPQGLLTYDAPAAISRAVDAGRALILSQFQPDSPWETHAAVTRNATIGALARLVCVVEPRKTGGSIRAARIAIGLGKPVAAWCSTPATRRLLETAGAAELADQAGRLRREYLRELWRQNVRTAPVQPDLLQDMPLGPNGRT
ncbi:MAG TPA: DNA-processing protein DprA [Candidatus Bathyarchaeia archaeon]|nr:DNA-processing protein DprA [Candidatus Bathyarchaeia archaeon]